METGEDGPSAPKPGGRMTTPMATEREEPTSTRHPHTATSTERDPERDQRTTTAHPGGHDEWTTGSSGEDAGTSQETHQAPTTRTDADATFPPKLRKPEVGPLPRDHRRTEENADGQITNDPRTHHERRSRTQPNGANLSGKYTFSIK